MKNNDDSKIRIYQKKTPPVDTCNRTDLKVVSYRNYGHTITSEDGSALYFWSFYQLNSYTIIGLKYTEYIFSDKNINPDLNFFLSRSYKFKDDFWQYWKKSTEENNNLHKKFRKIKYKDEEERNMCFEMTMGYNRPYENEEQCVRDYFISNIEAKRYDKTEKINVQ
jgi:hypothetical protein